MKRSKTPKSARRSKRSPKPAGTGGAANRSRRAAVLRQVQSRGLVAIPAGMRGDTEIFRVVAREDGVIELHPQLTVDKSQAWFWSEDWQRREREADADIAAGRVKRFESTDGFISHLKRA